MFHGSKLIIYAAALTLSRPLGFRSASPSVTSSERIHSARSEPQWANFATLFTPKAVRCPALMPSRTRASWACAVASRFHEGVLS